MNLIRSLLNLPFILVIYLRIAGSETSSTAITVTLMFLAKNKKKLKRLRAELDQATEYNPAGTLPTYDQVRKLPYLAACINESMRLRPVAATGTDPCDFFSGEHLLCEQLVF
jgi:cytochrome P450